MPSMQRIIFFFTKIVGIPTAKKKKIYIRIPEYEKN